MDVAVYGSNRLCRYTVRCVNEEMRARTQSWRWFQNMLSRMLAWDEVAKFSDRHLDFPAVRTVWPPRDLGRHLQSPSCNSGSAER